MKFYRNHVNWAQFAKNVLSCEVPVAQHKIGRNSHSNLFQPWRMHDIGSQRAPCFRLRFDGNSWTCSAGTRKPFLHILSVACYVQYQNQRPLKKWTEHSVISIMQHFHLRCLILGGGMVIRMHPNKIHTKFHWWVKKCFYCCKKVKNSSSSCTQKKLHRTLKKNL